MSSISPTIAPAPGYDRLLAGQLSFYGTPATVVEAPTDPTNSDRSTLDTLHIMTRLARASAERDPLLAQITQGLVAPLPNPHDQLRAIFGWVKGKIELVEDEAILAAVFGKPPGHELLISPSVLIRMDAAKGDCDDFAMLSAAMLMQAGFPVWYTVVADGRGDGAGLGVDAEQAAVGDFISSNDRLVHVYVETMRGGDDFSLIPFDASYGSYVGWEYQDYTRKERVWVG